MEKKTKSPLKARPLRIPGQSLDEKIADLMDGKVFIYVLIAVLPPVLAAWEWQRWYTNAPYSPKTLTVFALLCACFSFYKLYGLRKEIIRLKQGRDGERAVGQYLELLRDQGYKVFHDIIGKGFNIDHVVICSKGTFAIETKTFSKPDHGKAIIKNHGSELAIGENFKSSQILDQARAEAAELDRILRGVTGRKIRSIPVVVFPGWYIEDKSGGSDVWVLNPKALPKFISNRTDQLTLEDVSFYANNLSRYIRAKEEKS